VRTKQSRNHTVEQEGFEADQGLGGSESGKRPVKTQPEERGSRFEAY